VSTGYQCLFFKWAENEWYYLLQDWTCPVGAWDWREYSTAYGSFEDKEKAIDHLNNNHANPGGWITTVNPDKNDPVLIEAIEKSNP